MRLQQTQSGSSQRFSDSASSAPLDRQQLQQEQQKCQQHDLYSQQQQHHQQLGVIHPLSAPLPEMYSLLPPRQSSHFTEVHPPLIGYQPHYSPSPLPQSLYMSSYSPSAAQESLHGIKPFTDMTGFQTHASTDHEPNNHDGGERHTTDVIDHHKPYVCNHQDCGKAFKQNGNLKTHKRKHTGERPYQCNYEGCGKAFAQLGNLQTHEKIHWPVKPYLCDFPHCNRGFTQRANLKVHLFRIHYSNTS